MAIELRNPLPPGRYWVDVPSDDLAEFRQWLRDRPTQIRVEGTRELEGALGSPTVHWYLFRVIQPVPWFGPGSPTIATEEVTSSDDTVQRPPPELDFSDTLLSLIRSPPPALKWAAWGTAGLLVTLGVIRFWQSQPIERRGRGRRSKKPRGGKANEHGKQS